MGSGRPRQIFVNLPFRGQNSLQTARIAGVAWSESESRFADQSDNTPSVGMYKGFDLFGSHHRMIIMEVVFWSSCFCWFHFHRSLAGSCAGSWTYFLIAYRQARHLMREPGIRAEITTAVVISQGRLWLAAGEGGLSCSSCMSLSNCLGYGTKKKAKKLVGWLQSMGAASQNMLQTKIARNFEHILVKNGRLSLRWIMKTEDTIWKCLFASTETYIDGGIVYLLTCG